MGKVEDNLFGDLGGLDDGAIGFDLGNEGEHGVRDLIGGRNVHLAK